MTSDLPELLRAYINSGSRTNTAVEFLISDYAKYHYVMVILGGISAGLLLFLAFNQSRKFWFRTNSLRNLRTFSGKIHFYVASLSGFLGLLLTLISVGNLGNALNARSGFLNSLPMLESHQSDNHQTEFQTGISNWFYSGKSSVPPEINRLIDERLSWQRPKAIISLILLVSVIYISKKLWNSLIFHSSSISRNQKVAQFSGGIVLSLFVVLFLAMFIGNTQGSIAPVALSLFYS